MAESRLKLLMVFSWLAFSEALGDKTADVVIANAAITIFVDMDKVLKAWEKKPI